jgi:hypothetical protein
METGGWRLEVAIFPPFGSLRTGFHFPQGGAAMKKYRVIYRPNERASEVMARTEEVYADGWRVDSDADVVLLYLRQEGQEVRVLDVPKSLIMRIHEVV